MKLSKVFSIITVALVLVISVGNVALALDPSTITATTNATTSGELKTMAGKIIGAIQMVGSVIAVLVLVVIGVKYMVGSAEEKAEYKKTMIPYIVGAVLIFAASNVAGIIYDMTSTL